MVQFHFTDEQQQFRSVLRRFLDEKSPSTVVRRLMESETGWDRAEWRSFNDQLGWAGIHIPEAYGGQGFGIVELGIALEEMGRALLCAPFFASTVLAATAIVEAGSEVQKRTLLPGIATTEMIATLAIAELDGRWDADGVATIATRSGGVYRLDGTKSFVVDGHSAEVIVVLARKREGPRLFVVRGDTSGLERRGLKTLDPTRRLARLDFHGVEAELLGEEGDDNRAFATVMNIALIGLAHEMVGGAERLREAALDYAKLRLQFGRPIASFQAIKHKAADMLVDVELARSAAYYAASAADEGLPDLSALASLAKAQASDTYVRTAIEAVQIHGGIGFTWDHDTHLWFRRARSSERFLGDPAFHRDRMIAHLEQAA